MNIRLQIERSTVLTVAAAIAAVLLCGWFTVRPAWEHYESLSLQRDLLASEALRDTPVSVQISALEDEVAALQRRLDGHEGRLPADETEAHVLAALQELSWRHHIVLGGIEPRAAEAVGAFERRAFEVDMRARFPALVAWFADLEQQLGFALVESFRLTAARGADAAPDLRVRLEVVAYRGDE